MRIRTIIFGLIFVALAWGIYADYSVPIAAYFLETKSPSLEKVGQWGDAFGGFNALVSTIGAMVIVWTLLLQQQAARTQARDVHIQQFDTAFFNLLNLLRELKSELVFNHNSEYAEQVKNNTQIVIDEEADHVGLNAINAALREIILLKQFYYKNDAITSDGMENLYNIVVYRRNDTTFSPYIRIIYTILTRIKEDKVLSELERHRYSNLLRSQITARELHVLAYNCKHKVSKDLESLLSEFHMFKYMQDSDARKWIEGNFNARIFEART